MANIRHRQHTEKFYYELNSVNANKPNRPFRISDEIWLVGKYKGKKLDDIPKSYLEWVLKSFSLSSSDSLILKNKLNETRY
jgi:hypothetical protein